MNTTGAIILAGGQSQRMGRDKALLPWPAEPGQPTFVERLVSLLSSQCAEVALVGRDAEHVARLKAALGEQERSVQVVADRVPGRGPLMGIYSGLCLLQASRALVCAVDMPFVLPEMVAFLLACGSDDTLCVPLVDDVPQILLAVYPRTLIGAIEERLRAGRRDPRSLLQVAPVSYITEARLCAIDPQLRSFININTPQELASHRQNKQHH
ncbi:MAG: molybdenum cofactor guanylyltransferase [Ktedonobacteraceae bacterium]|nr:molybdenum cofactor guanylyltransferase [Ktedonobacteraceae bacterium]